MKKLILLLLLFSVNQLHAKKIFEIYNKTTGKSVKVGKKNSFNLTIKGKQDDKRYYHSDSLEHDTLYVNHYQYDKKTEKIINIKSAYALSSITKIIVAKTRLTPDYGIIAGPVLIIGGVSTLFTKDPDNKDLIWFGIPGLIITTYEAIIIKRSKRKSYILGGDNVINPI